jgi:hypothetical protein
MENRPVKKSLYDAYRFPGFTPGREVKGVFGDSLSLVIRLNRRSKKLPAERVVQFTAVGTISAREEFETLHVETAAFTWMWRCAVSLAASVAP